MVSLTFTTAVCLSLLFAPFVRNSIHSNSVWYLNYRTGTAIFFAAIAAFILGVGLSLIVISVGYLFEIKVGNIIYSDIWVFSFAGLFPLYVLANLSREFEFEDSSCQFPKGVRFITNYILVPLMWAYMLLLYIYFIRIVATWELPRGNLGWMIITFGSVGIITKLLVYPIRGQGNVLLSLFDRYFYAALLLPVMVLYIAIYVRIQEYGVTESRYLVVVLGLWFLIIAVLSYVKRINLAIKHVPMVLAVLMLFASFGPWSATNLASSSQTERFISLLNKHSLIEQGKAIKAQNDIPFEDKKSLSAIADYLTASEKRLKIIQPLFSDLKNDKPFSNMRSRRHRGGEQIMKALGLDYSPVWESTKNQDRFEFVSVWRSDKQVIDVSDYDAYFESNLSFYSKRKKQQFIRNLKQQNQRLTTRLDDNTLVLDVNDVTTLRIDLGKQVADLFESKVIQKSEQRSPLFVIDKATDSHHIRILIKKLAGNRGAKGELIITRIEFTVLIGKY